MDFKVKCVRVKKYPEFFTEGKVYEVKDGKCVCDNSWTADAWALPINGNTDFEAFSNWFRDWFEFELVEDKKVFTKSDLKTGDFVMRANGVEEVFIEHLKAFTGKAGWMPLSNVNDDLTHSGCDHGWDIVKVRRPTTTCHCQFDCPSFGELVYDRARDTKPLYNGKVVCIDATLNEFYTVGKIYQFKDGQLTADHGKRYPEDNTNNTRNNAKIHNFEDWSNWSTAKWIEIKE